LQQHTTRVKQAIVCVAIVLIEFLAAACPRTSRHVSCASAVDEDGRIAAMINQSNKEIPENSSRRVGRVNPMSPMIPRHTIIVE
jgi:hypothetical protein